MTLDEAIARLNDKHNHTLVFNPKQLAGFLTELKELREENEKLMSHVCDLQLAYNNELIDGRKAKRLLKAAVKDMRWVNENTQDTDGTCVMRKCEGCGDCPLDINGDLWCKWKHEAEALALIGEEEK